MRILAGACGLAIVLGLLSVVPEARAQSVLEYHAGSDRSGRYTMPHLTYENAATLRLDNSFEGKIAGDIYAQPLFFHFRQSPRKILIAATEDDTVFALDARTGKTAWMKNLGKPVQRADLPCGNISPLGITGTPAIDWVTATLYLDAMVASEQGPRHLVFGLSLDTGAVLPGFPVDVGKALSGIGKRFDPRLQNQRGALSIVNGRLYVPYGGHFGDCGDYRGWVVSIDQDHPSDVSAWSARAAGGGVWAPGGLAYDGRSLFIATGNTNGASEWADGEAVIRLGLDLKPATAPRGFFAPADWKTLDEGDLDLGGSNPLPFDLWTPDGDAKLVLALGKDGKAYLLDRTNLGGIGGALAVQSVARGPIRTSPAVFVTADAAFVAFEGQGSACPKGAAGAGLTMLRIEAPPAPKISTAWCAAVNGRGAPIVTIDDDNTNPIVWMVGAEGDNRLHGFRG
ncbi:MAG TPA: hypothetical protein VK433_04490, partial [Stellaceae bacterium]|nr:hypothetical protein [Stellaceae bacterium]